MGDHVTPYNPRFRLYMTTKLPNPHYSPEISTATTIINFAIKQEGEIIKVLTHVTNTKYFSWLLLLIRRALK